MYLTQALHRAVQQHPNRIATVFEDRSQTYANQHDRVARMAGALRELGVTRDTRVGVLALNSDRYGELLFAVPWADGIIVPLNTRWSEAEISYSLADSETDLLFVDDAFAAMVPNLRTTRPELRSVVYMGEHGTPDGMLDYERLVAQSTGVGDARRGGSAPAGIFYTGGTTGFPKGVVITHANLLTSALGSQATEPIVAVDGVLLHVAPMFHLADLAAWTAQVVVGGSHVMLPGFEPARVLRAIEEHRITNMLMVPTMMQVLVDHDDVPKRDLSSMRMILYGASPITESVLKRAMAAFPSASFVQAYGMTELAPIATLLTGQDHRDGFRLRSAGRAAAHCEVRVVNAEDVELPRGEVGEIAVAGGHVMAGYWNRPDDTAAALKGGWMHTGDVGYMDADGYLYVVDRLKDMIISGGENVYSAEVENVVGRHPGVAACAVIGVPDADWGERVHAVVVLRPGASVEPQELQDHARESIAGYKVPRSFEFVDALPTSAAGKVLKRELREKHWVDCERAVN